MGLCEDGVTGGKQNKTTATTTTTQQQQVERQRTINFKVIKDSVICVPKVAQLRLSRQT